jgi:hypothetical protein
MKAFLSLRIRGWVLIGFLGCQLLSARAAQSMLAEYRIDGGTAQPMAPTSTNITSTFLECEFAVQVNTANLDIGPHYLEVRLQSTNGAWCAWQGQWFRIAGETALTAAEWYVDQDPGFGKGSPIRAPNDGQWGGSDEGFTVQQVDSSQLSVGHHTLFVRTQDSNGDWGLTNSTVFYVSDPLQIVRAEWTANPTNWSGTAYPMEAQDGAFDAESEELWTTTNSFTVCTNYFATRTLHVRVQDNWGRWSTRRGLSWDAAGSTWRFDADTGWADATAQLEIAPDLASNPTPASSQLLVVDGQNVTFNWQACRGISSHELYVRRTLTEPFALWSAGSTNNFFSTNLTAPHGTYEWIVRSMGGTECALDGPLWQFALAGPQAGDADKDGLPDDWERQKAGTLTVMNGSTDRDKDGLPDWQEYLIGTDPLSPGDEFGLMRLRKVPGKYAALGYPFGIVLEWMSVAGRQYAIYSVANLENQAMIWSPYEQVQGTGNVLSVTNFFPDPATFFRLSVSLP